ncbi:MAG: hypothetical protein ACE5OZ_16055 [Candidatus Heimdallarchaeota archaeon]
MIDPHVTIRSTRKGACFLVLVLGVLVSFQPHIAITMADSQDIVQSSEAYSLVIRISNISWEFHNYIEYIEASEFLFQVNLEIWNKDNETYTIAASNSCVYPLQAQSDLEDKSLSFQFDYGCLTVVTYDPIDPGLQNRTSGGYAFLNRTYADQLVTGQYRIAAMINDKIGRNEAFPLENSYGVNITVAEEGYTIVYDALPSGWPSPPETTVNTSQPTFAASATENPRTPQTRTSLVVSGVMGLGSLVAISFLLILRSKRRVAKNSKT